MTHCLLVTINYHERRMLLPPRCTEEKISCNIMKNNPSETSATQINNYEYKLYGISSKKIVGPHRLGV
jgi:hypothetical protein